MVGALTATAEEQLRALALQSLLRLLQRPHLPLQRQDLRDMLLLDLQHLTAAFGHAVAESGLPHGQLGQVVLQLLDFRCFLDEAFLLELLERINADVFVGLRRDACQFLEGVDGLAEAFLLAAEGSKQEVLFCLGIEHLLLLAAVFLLFQPRFGQFQLSHLLQQLLIERPPFYPQDHPHHAYSFAIEEAAQMAEDGLLELKAALPAALQCHELPEYLQELEVFVDGPANQGLLLSSAERQEVRLGRFGVRSQFDDDGTLISQANPLPNILLRLESAVHDLALMVILQDLHLQSLLHPCHPEQLLRIQLVLIDHETLILLGLVVLGEDVGEDAMAREGELRVGEAVQRMDKLIWVVEVALQFFPQLR